MRNNLIILALLATFIPSKSQQATIREERIPMKTYMFSDPDPVPDMEKNYPYFRFDGYTNRGTTREWNMVIMENDHIQVFITPEIGGKIWGAVEKSTGGEFVYYNDVVKFRDVAHRGPWTSGGIEFNFGIMSHVSTCSTPQDYLLKRNPDGSVSCVIGAIDLHTMTKWNVEILLPKDKAYFETRATWFSTENLPTPFYHYMNAAAKTAGNLEFIYPGSHYIGHGGDAGTWPFEGGRNISFYDNNDFGSYKSYHVLNAYSGIMGGYWHEDRFGFGRLGSYDEMPGKKIWIWGLSREGMIWEDLLTDTKGQYIEWQTGKSFNQAMTRSGFTPFKHNEFTPFDSDISTEVWFPLKGTGGMVAASRFGVLNAIREAGFVKITLSALQGISDDLVIRTGGNEIARERVVLDPLELFSTSVELDPDGEFTVTLGNDLLHYSSNRNDLIVDRPLEPNPQYDWNSAVGLFTQGLELERMQSYTDGGQANRKALEFYLRSLEVDPAYAPALNRTAMAYIKQHDLERSMHYVKRSLAIDTYDPEANYLFGLIHDRLGNRAGAKSGFSMATQSTAYRNAAFTELSRIFLREKRYGTAAEYAQKALVFNRYNTSALELLFLAKKKLGDGEMCGALLERLGELDPTSPFVRYEELIEEGGDPGKLDLLVTNELAFETYLQLAVSYFNRGFPEESLRVLELAPENATVLLWLAYLDEAKRSERLRAALEASPGFVFPHRDETLMVLEELMEESDSWKLKYYTALVYWKKAMIGRAKELFRQCGTDPDHVPFYLAKANLFRDEMPVREEALTRAGSLDKADWRVNRYLAAHYLATGRPELAETHARESLEAYPERSVLGLSLAEALLQQGRYDACIEFLEGYHILPFEGAVSGRRIYHEAAIRASLKAMDKRKYKIAIGLAEKATLWPENLGSGKPYQTDERLENFLIATCYDRLGKSSRARPFYTRVTEHRQSDRRPEGSLLYLQALALKKLGHGEKAVQLIEDALAANPDNACVKWVHSAYWKEPAGEVSGEPGDLAGDCGNLALLNEFISILNQDEE